MKLVQVQKGHWVFQAPEISLEIDRRVDQANDLWRNDKIERADGLFQVVIEQCPTHIDAIYHRALMHRDIGSDVDAYLFLCAAVGVGLQAIPSGFHWEDAEIAWGHLENRPFLRAYHTLGLWRFDNEDFDGALEIFSRLLLVNPNDNQGCRYLLPKIWMATGDHAMVVTHCRNHSDEIMPEFTYTLALALSNLGKKPEAQEVLENAVQELPLVKKELLKKKHPRPRNMNTGYITIGGQDQAYEYWRQFGEYWQQSDAALKLLTEVGGG